MKTEYTKMRLKWQDNSYLEVSHGEQGQQREGHEVEQGWLGSLENFWWNRCRQQAEEVANEGAVEVAVQKQKEILVRSGRVSGERGGGFWLTGSENQ